MPLPISSTPASSSPSLQEKPAIVSSSFSKNPSEEKKKKSFALPQFPKFNKLQKKLAISIVGLILVLVGGLATYLVSRQSQDIRQRAYDQNSQACTALNCNQAWQYCDYVSGSNSIFECKTQPGKCGDPNSTQGCTNGFQCDDSHNCTRKTCTPPSGSQCDEWQACNSGFCELKNGRCERTEDCTNGQACSTDHQCQVGACRVREDCPYPNWQECSYSTGSGKCVTPVGRCASPGSVSGCEEGQICSNTNTCIPKPCTDSTNCPAWQTCSQNQCTLRSGYCPNVGQITGCATGICGDAHTCIAAACTSDAQCFEWETCPTTTKTCTIKAGRCSNPGTTLGCATGFTCNASHTCASSSPPPSGAAAPGSPAPVPPAPNLCPNDPSLTGVIWRKFVCNSCIRETVQGPNGDWGTGWRCESGTPTESNSPLTLGPNECGQVDVYTSSSYNSFCGYASGSQTYSCGEARCQGEDRTGTPRPTPASTPVIIPGAACIGMNLGSDTDGISNYGGQAPFLSTDPLTKTITLTLKVRNTTAATAQILINDGNCGQPITFNKVGTVGDTSTYRGTIAFSQFKTCPQSYGSPGAHYIQFTGTAGSPVDTTKCVASARITNPPPGEPPTEPVCTGLKLMQTANSTRTEIPANHSFSSTEYMHLQCDLPAGTTSVDYRVIPPGQTPVTIPTFRSVSIITALMMSETFQVSDYPTNSEYQCRPCVGSLCSAWTTLPAACKKPVAWTVPLACTSVVSNPVAPTLSSTATFTCNGTSATRYEFEYKAPGSTTYTSLAASTTVSRSVATSALVAGAYQYRCRACSGLATCTQNDVTACQGTFTVPVASCNQTCTTDADCSNGTKCFDVGGTTGKVCRNTTNTTCSATTDCTCPTPAPTPVVTSTPAPQPDAGFIAVKYNDLNGNGSKQDTEPGLSWNFEWDRNGNNTWTAYETYGDRNGQGGRLGGLADGDTIRVREKSKDGWRATTTTQHSIVVHKNETAVVYFGNQQTSSKVLATCNGSCSSNGDCVSGYTCSSGMCRNASCTSSSSCVCTSTTKTTTVTPKATAKPAATALPLAGDGLKSAGAIGFGVVITVLGLIGLLAL